MRSKRWRKRLNSFLAVGLVASMLVPSIPAIAKAEPAVSDLFISEYIEGSSFNKAVELYNGTGQTVDLSQYSLELYANGATVATSKLTLSGTLGPNKTFVVYHRDAVAGIKDKGNLENMSVINFNGDDALVLKKEDKVIDSFGQVGVRNNWGMDVTLVRKAAITSGDSVPNDAFNRNDEWSVYPKDTFDYLGSHEMDGTEPGEPGNPDEPGESLLIHDIQGEGHVSPYNGQSVKGVEGIVTYKYVLNGSTYYHIQTPDDKRDGNMNTSEAIVLYSGRDAWNLSVGDLVSVTGKVSEYAIDGYADRQETDLKTTQINVRDDQGGKVKILERNVPLPTPFIINERNLPQDKIASYQFIEFDPTKYAADFWESREAMLVQVGNVKAVGPQEHGDLVTVFENAATETVNGGILLKEDDQNAERVQFRLEPNGPARDFEVATGDRFEGPITGVVGYSFQNYKIYTSLNDMQQAHVKGDAIPEKTTIVKAEDKLTIASYNLENFSNNTKTTSIDKAKKLARAFAVDMQSPDIIGVTEVQDNNGPDAGDSKANQSYERLIQAIVDAGGVKYEYVNIDPVNNEDGGQPNANIRVGFLYNPARVSLTEGIPHGDATTAVGYENGKLTLNPGRISPNDPAFNSSRKPLAAQFDFQGESIVVIANHWNSKTGDTPLFGSTQPPIYGSEVQRKKIAQLVYDFISEIKTDNPDANIVSLGDFNDFQFAEPLKIHEGSIMTNMINHVEKADRYSYVYQGNSQVLDHILVSNNLVDQTEIDILHINADFTDMAGRASDHDPVMVQIGFEAPVVWEPVPIKKVYNLINYHKKQVMIAEPNVAVYMDAQSSLKDGMYLKGDYAELTGEGFKTNTVILQPKKKGLIVDMKGTEMSHVIVEGSNPLEIRGAENIKKIDFVKGADASKVIFYNSKGKRITEPTFNTESLRKAS
ncbi:lamin tail domain-containing protein [Sporosarcina highlanderae]|uniref:Lamin tail domain-containing protein n=1 Tax=Sporosarcina highlanderae TaxID=3035916 RepID=A0ABT8JV17_9BACL|nr:lamin tail domain-containing protein [Sporosarcina highlanderae]MDN4608024.1 lamin tail domain-containing protein [Sporosarcina highlanderae]